MEPDELRAALERSWPQGSRAGDPITRRGSLWPGAIRWAFLVACVSVFFIAAPAGRAEDTLAVSVTPAEVALTPGAHVSGVLLLTNSGMTRITGHLQAVGNDSSVDAHVAKSTVSVGPGSSVALTYTVTRSAEGTGQDTAVRFVLAWSQAGSGSAKAHRAAIAIVKVKAASSLALLEAKIESNVTNINENRPGAAALIVTNPRDESVELERLRLSAPDAIDVALTCPGGGVLEVKGGTTETFAGCSLAVPPRSQEMLPLRFKTIDRVAPGPRTVLVKVTGRGADSHSQSAVASTSFTVDVFAESDILKAIGVPVFLLLPGVVIVLAGWFLVQKLSPWRQVTGDKGLGSVVSAATATAVLGLAISLLVALVYPKLTALVYPRYERDYLTAYGFRDFYYVLAYSFAIAVAIWLLAISVFYVARSLFLPWQDDQPLSLLRKLGVRGLLRGRTNYPRVVVTENPTTSPRPRPKGLLLGKRTGGRLVAPTIALAVVDSTRTPRLAGKIEDEVAASRAFRLWWTVRDAVDDGVATLSYRSDNIAAPRLVEASNVTADGQSPGPIVEVQRT